METKDNQITLNPLVLKGRYNFETVLEENHLDEDEYKEILKLHERDFKKDEDKELFPLKSRIYSFKGLRSNYGIPKDAKLGIIRSLDKGLFKKSIMDEELREVLRSKFIKGGIDISIEEFLTSQSFNGLLKITVETIVEDNDGIIIMPPVSPLYESIIRTTGRRVIKCPLLRREDGSYSMDFEMLDRLLKEKLNRTLFICNPQGPMGKVYDKEDLIKVVNFLKKRNTLLIADESILEFNFSEEVTSVINLGYDYAVSLYNPSLIFNTWTIGGAYAVTRNESYRNKLKKSLFINSMELNNELTNIALISSYLEEDYMREYFEHIDKNRNYLKNFSLNNNGIFKVIDLDAGHTAYLDFSPLNLTARKLEDFLKKDAKLFMDEGSSFMEGDDQCYRMNLACPWSLLNKHLLLLKDANERRILETLNPLMKVKRKAKGLFGNLVGDVKDKFKSLLNKNR